MVTAATVVREPSDLTPEWLAEILGTGVGELDVEPIGTGLIESAALELAPGDLRLEVEPLAFGPLRLEAPDGRVSKFPRAMCGVRAADGREGLAWLEWNRNQPS